MKDVQPIVVGLDLSEGSKGALVRAADLAERFHARLHLVYAAPTMRVEHGDTLFDEAVKSVERRTRTFVEDALGGPKGFDVVGPEVVVRRGEAAADALVRYAEEVEAGLMVLGTHGYSGVRRFLMGSVAEEVARRAPCPVLTVPFSAVRTLPGPQAPVLVAVDFSGADWDAIAAAKVVSSQFEAPVELVHVADPNLPYPGFYGGTPGLHVFHDSESDLEARAETHLQGFCEKVGDVARYHVRHGQPHGTIVENAEERGAGLIVMATHEHSILERMLVGSVADRVMRTSPCPILLIPTHLDEAEAGELASDSQEAGG